MVVVGSERKTLFAALFLIRLSSVRRAQCRWVRLVFLFPCFPTSRERDNSFGPVAMPSELTTVTLQFAQYFERNGPVRRTQFTILSTNASTPSTKLPQTNLIVYLIGSFSSSDPAVLQPKSGSSYQAALRCGAPGHRGFMIGRLLR